MDKWLADKKNDEMLASCEVNERLDTPKKKVQKRNNMTPEDKERYRRATENAEQMDLFQGGMEE
jgi:hypothetical protein